MLRFTHIVPLVMLSVGCAASEEEMRRDAVVAHIADDVKVITGDPPAGCRELGAVEEMVLVPSYARLYRSFKLRVARMGGNTARIDFNGKRGDMTAMGGVAFACAVVASTDPR